MWYRQIKFSGYRKKQKTFDILAKRLEEKEVINEDNKKNKKNKKKKIKEKVLIGWGNGGNGSGKLKGSKVPGKAFRKYIEKNTSIVVVDVDENLTTKMCSNCGFETGMMKEYRTIKRVTEEKGEETMYKNVKVYGIRRCKNNDCRITWDRDVNASENILKILLCHLERKDRPTYLCRKSKDLVSDARKGAVSETTNPKKTVGELHELSKTKIKILIKKKIDLSQSL
jgi:transposase